MSKIEFGLLLPHGAESPAARASYVADYERNFDMIKGHFTSVWMSDHFQVGSGDVMECWTTLAYFAGRYPELSFGSGVLCQAYRNPALVAKMAATFQLLSGGRLLLGIGAGWKEDEFRAYNYPFPAAGVRVSELEEAVQIIKSMWTEEETTFDGEHYQVYGARCAPRPDPLPPIVIGAHQPRMLRIAARFADWWDITGSSVARDDYPALSAEMERVLEEVGRDPQSIRRTFTGPCVIAASPAEVKELAKKLPAGKGIVGTPDEVVAQLARFIDLGVTGFHLVFSGFPDPQRVELFISEVLPRIEAL